MKSRFFSASGWSGGLAGWVVVIGWFFLSPAGTNAAASFRAAGEDLRLETPRWAMTLDARQGAIRAIQDRAADGVLLRGSTNLWIIERHREAEIAASAQAFRHSWDAAREELSLEFDGPDASVAIVCAAGPAGPLWKPQVRLKHGVMTGWRFPAALEFEVADLEEFVFPENLGLAFTRKFFEPGGSGVQRQNLGAAGWRLIANDRCQMRPVDDEGVALKPGKDAAEWLPQWYLQEMSRWKVVANRCPAGTAHDLSLVETEHGAWLSAYRLGGWGWLFRFGGMLRESDTRPQLASVSATLTRLYLAPTVAGQEVNPPTGFAGQPPARWAIPPKRIGLVVSRPAGRPGTKQNTGPGVWLAELQRLKWIKEAGLEIVVLREPAALRQALAEPRQWFAIINTLAESFPAETMDQARSLLADVRQFVRQGGIWWEAGGGYPFYSALAPRQDAVFRTANRDFCDFAALRSRAGQWALFGIQKPADIYVPAEAEISARGPADKRRGGYTHKFHAYGRPDLSLPLPPQQMILGRASREALAEYGQRNELIRGLTDKAKPETVDKLKRAILLKVATRQLTETIRIAEELKFPVLFHIAEYLRGGFDKQYPDHLPPNPEMGTPEDLDRLVKVCRQKGHLFMPYTNPTWWCVNPKGPTFEREGEAPLSRTLEGGLYPERYGANYTQGYSICAWHPAVRRANDVTRDQFTRQYPVAVLFQDQVGARGHKFDANPAAPHAGAYLEGIHRIARVDSAYVPLGTEDGHDRLINYEVIFAGLSWPWLPNRPGNPHVLYEDLWPADAWRHEPLALFLAHDKVLFYHHDLGGFIRNRLDLSISLVMGYGLSWWTRSATPPAGELDWLERLCRLQAAIGPRCAGRALNDFSYLAPQVIRSRWGDLEIIANLNGSPWKVDEATVIAPEGFLARSPSLEAGILARRAARDLAEPQWLIRERVGADWSEWRAGPETPSR